MKQLQHNMQLLSMKDVFSHHLPFITINIKYEMRKKNHFYMKTLQNSNHAAH